MQRLKLLPELRLGPRTRIVPGMRVRLSGGGVFGYRGVARVRHCYAAVRGERRFLNVFFESGPNAGVYATVFVQGKPFPVIDGLKQYPHKVSIPR